jgi:hypothetical protein
MARPSGRVFVFGDALWGGAGKRYRDPSTAWDRLADDPNSLRMTKL